MLSSLTVYNNSKLSIRLWHAMRSGFYMATGDNQLSGWTERSPEALPKAKLAPKKDHGHCLVVWSTIAFWIPAKLLHLRSMLSKSMRCTEKYNVCSQPWSLERPQFFSMTMPDCMSHNQCFKSGTNWATKFCLIHHMHLTSHQPTTTSSSIWTTFGRENPSTTSRRQKMISKTSSNLETWFLCYKNEQTCFSLAKMCWL